MDIFETVKRNILILELRGKLDAMASPEFREKIISKINDGNHKIILDCSNLDYISSAGLRVFFEVINILRDLSGSIVCYSLNNNVKKVFVLADLVSDISIYSSQEDALNNISQ